MTYCYKRKCLNVGKAYCTTPLTYIVKGLTPYHFANLVLSIKILINYRASDICFTLNVKYWLMLAVYLLKFTKS